MVSPDVLSTLLVAGLASARREQGVTYEVLASRIDVSKTGLIGWLSGRRQITLRDYLRIANALGFSVGTMSTDPKLIDLRLPVGAASRRKGR